MINAMTRGRRTPPARQNAADGAELPAGVLHEVEIASNAGKGGHAQLNAEIEAFLQHYAATYCRQDYAGLLDLWDRDDPDVMYIAEEIDPPMHGWEPISNYFDRPGTLEGVRYRVSDVVASPLAPDLAMASYLMRFDLKITGMNAMSGMDRVVVVLRKKNGEWKLARYAEAPQAPLTMVRRFAEMGGATFGEREKKLMRELLTMQEEAVPEDFADWIAAGR